MTKIMKFLSAILHFLVTHPLLLTGLATMLLCLVVWFGGELVGLVSQESRQIVIVGMILVWLLFALFEWMRAFKNSQKIEKTLYDQSHTQAIRAIDEQKEKIQSLQRQFDKALGTLKRSKLTGGIFWGKTALSTLPWYMFIGPPATGKTTALMDSGLEFPCTSENRRGIQGIGGTRNCDWWFTNQGVLLDTAGRYVMEEEDQEWTAFLQMLKKGRKPYALNGVMVAVSLMDVVQWTEQDLEWNVKQIRRRLDQLITTLGIIFPVYVVFTKCDLLRGFLPFFNDLTKTEREQIWGSTVAWDTKVPSSSAALFEDEFDGLVKRLIGQRQRALLQTQNSELAAEILQFPLQFASCKQSLSRFIEVLFHPNRYQDNPRFRGFYFTSGTQVGRPIDRILSSIIQASGLALSEKNVTHETGAAKSFFIKDFFTQVVFPDQNLAFPTSKRYRQQGALRIATFIGGSIIVGLATAGLVSSYGANQYTLHSIDDSIQSLTQFPSYSSHDRKLEALEGVRKELTSIESFQERGLPYHLWGGFYKGFQIYQPLQTRYQEHFKDFLLLPTRQSIEEDFRKFLIRGDVEETSAEYDRIFQLLKTYLLMTDNPKRMELVTPTPVQEENQTHPGYFFPSLLTNQWMNKVQGVPGNMTKNANSFVQAQFTYYTNRLATALSPELSINDPLKDRVADRLANVQEENRYYPRLVSAQLEKSEKLSIEDALVDPRLNIFQGKPTIPAIFSKSGWAQFQVNLKQTLEEFEKDEWVLLTKERTKDDLAQSLQARYFGDYVTHWMAFLQNIRIKEFKEYGEMLGALEVLTEEPSPFYKIFRFAKEQTGLVKNPELSALLPESQNSTTGVDDKLALEQVKRQQKKSRVNRIPEFVDPVFVTFSGIHDFITDADQEPEISVLRKYEAKLADIHRTFRKYTQEKEMGPQALELAKTVFQGEVNRFTEARDLLDQDFLGTLPSTMYSQIKPLFLKPVTLAFSGILHRAMGELNRRWKIEVLGTCQQVADYYPFSPNASSGISPAKLTEFLHPTKGVLWDFYQKELKVFMNESTPNWERKAWEGLQLGLSDAALKGFYRTRMLSDSLFPGAHSPTPQITFYLTPYADQGPEPGAVATIKLSIGDQTLEYQMGKQNAYQFVWPPDNDIAQTVLELQIMKNSEGEYLRETPFREKGTWGWFRLVQKGQLNENQDVIKWDYLSDRAIPRRIQYGIRVQPNGKLGVNPFTPKFFEIAQVDCLPELGATRLDSSPLGAET